ncbi:SRPBCC domain-containing protein [Actinoplanes bogorensis]|uniref:SRPBCC domain-containing protein n=1 Tax=Paractinoplanes bogorensis TaxID=1610840 RepID=A0ABS5YPT7_9ACTN|nr:SRPBCC domain-containing protein [Actinoplanes bogorensis]MBU2665341.1 SRPBCC domain-containing protein [Actinoplanes bogorensis]
MTSLSFTVDNSPQEVFKAVTNVGGWWTGVVEGDPAGEFTYRYEDLHYSRQRVIEWVTDRKVVWRVTEAHLTFVADPAEWVGTEIVFEVVPQGARTEVRFTHEGLRSDFECYEQCSSAWAFFVNASLRRLIETGDGPATPPWAA